ncbi:hypothetical protein ACFY93_22340 [Streptomyces sp. NPDC008313]|uniref:hypothetical protein n=1 Tax=Streptomyces sp. NPDC008313 TaxID=3364826 RepID=UPI0036E5D372
MTAAVVLCAIFGGIWFGYQQIFRRGIDRLPATLCDGAVKREVAARVLPEARSAGHKSDVTGAGDNFMFACRVDTSDDYMVSGEAIMRDVSESGWADFYEQYGGDNEGKVVRVPSGDVRALSKRGFATVYVPCVPRGVDAADADETYALVTEARVVGKHKANGIELRQALTDFAYQVTVHAYAVAECQKPRDFPEELPRYETG